ncbi:C-GCAxxG-C-C family (seleno)protein [Shewanella pneumatophori]|uniref:C-GCAxxG-C-C family protein n=1 Tax=Shewanella pneumatophori TaxID=314092 RepID=A0A9X1Z8U5_9GAMM|nr:C-GCAxxG-C-C family (seleno)protein [Shewanella pneumatophori]MCL1137684.1 C-GCAxxG-C-C family protein [Shewanella pneumatophori]
MMNRRDALKKFATFSVVSTGSVFVPTVLANTQCSNNEAIDFGSNGNDAKLLTYIKLDPMSVAKQAYAGYDRGGCMYGVFDAIIKSLADAGHEDACRFAAIPTNMATFGKGGVFGIGSICGCVNAAAMAINLLAGINQSAVSRALFRFYEKSEMPRGDSAFLTAIGAPTRKTDDGTLLEANLIGKSIAGSTLCHTSVTLWSKASQFGSSHQAKFERCAQVTAEVAYMLVTYLNQSLEGTLEAELVAPANQDCAGCHSSTAREPDAYLGTDVNSTLECQSCHSSHDMAGGVPVHEELTCSDCH